MRKFLALAVMATALIGGSVARAAIVDIYVTQQSAGSQLWDITATVSDASKVGGIALLGNATMVALAPNAANPGISPLDSTLAVDVLGDGTTNAMSINSTGVGVAIAQGSAPTLLGTLTILVGSGPNPGGITGGESLYGYSAALADAAATPIQDTLVHVVAANPVPEASTMLMLGFGLAGLGLVRRKAA